MQKILQDFILSPRFLSVPRICCIPTLDSSALLIAISNPDVSALVPHFRLSAVHFHSNVTSVSLFEIELLIGVLENEPFTPNSLFPLTAPPLLTLRSYLKDTSTSFSLPPTIFRTNQSLRLADPCLKMVHVSVHASPFPRPALWCKYNFMSEIPDKKLLHVGRHKFLTLVLKTLLNLDLFLRGGRCKDQTRFLIDPTFTHESFPTDSEKESPILASVFQCHQSFQGQFNSHVYITMPSQKILAHSATSSSFYLKHSYCIYYTHLWYLLFYYLTVLKHVYK